MILADIIVEDGDCKRVGPTRP